MNEESLKTCVKCNQLKNVTEYHKDSSSPDGFNNRCKSCVNQYNRDRYNSNPEFKKQHSQRMKNRTESELEKARKSGRNWYNTPKGRAKTILKGIRERNTKYSEEIDFDEDYLIELIERGYCEVTKIPFVLGSVKDGAKKPFSPSIDRIDSSKGYCKENIRLVLWQVNLMKGELSDDELLDFCYSIIAGLSNE